MHRTFGILAMSAIVVLSNILVQVPLGGYLTWGALTYPLAFLVTDLANRLQGPAAARQIVIAGFAVGVACSLVGTQIDGPAGPVVTLRVALGSGLAFLLAQLLDIAVFHRLRDGTWWRAPLVSTVAASALDTAVFFSVAFSSALTFLEPANDVAWAAAATPLLGLGPAAPFWVSLALADWLVKIALALIALVPFRLLAVRFGERTA
jgi:queuosine precursor transporter